MLTGTPPPPGSTALAELAHSGVLCQALVFDHTFDFAGHRCHGREADPIHTPNGLDEYGRPIFGTHPFDTIPATEEHLTP